MCLRGPIVEVHESKLSAFVAIHEATLLCAIHLDTLVGVVPYQPRRPAFRPVLPLVQIWPRHARRIHWTDLGEVGKLESDLLQFLLVRLRFKLDVHGWGIQNELDA